MSAGTACSRPLRIEHPFQAATNPTRSSVICGGPKRTPKRLPLRLPCSDTRDVATVRAANSVPHATATIHGDRPQPRRSAVGAQLTANRSRSRFGPVMLASSARMAAPHSSRWPRRPPRPLETSASRRAGPSAPLAARAMAMTAIAAASAWGQPNSRAPTSTSVGGTPRSSTLMPSAAAINSVQAPRTTRTAATATQIVRRVTEPSAHDCANAECSGDHSAKGPRTRTATAATQFVRPGDRAGAHAAPLQSLHHRSPGARRPATARRHVPLRRGAARAMLGSGAGRQPVEVTGWAALGHLLLPRSLEVATVGQPDEDRVDGAGLQAQQATQIVAVTPVRCLLGQRIEDGNRLRRGTTHSGHTVEFYLDSSQRVKGQALGVDDGLRETLRA